MPKNKCRIGKRIVAWILVPLVLLALSGVFGYAVYQNGGLFTEILPNGGVSFLFLSVGQASCTLILTEDGAALIDTGSNDSEETVLSALLYYGVTEIEYVILTHADEDHAGGLDAILQAYSVGHVVLTKTARAELMGTRESDVLSEFVLEERTRLLTVTAGDELSLGDVQIEILAPTRQAEQLLGGGNESSLVLLLEYGETDAIFSGDAGRAGELSALYKLSGRSSDEAYELLLVGHHGSSSSTCEEFAKCISPQYAVISCGEYNSYGHPNIEVVTRLEKYGAQIYRTDRDGTVIFHSDGTSLTEWKNP